MGNKNINRIIIKRNTKQKEIDIQDTMDIKELLYFDYKRLMDIKPYKGRLDSSIVGRLLEDFWEKYDKSMIDKSKYSLNNIKEKKTLVLPIDMDRVIQIDFLHQLNLNHKEIIISEARNYDGRRSSSLLYSGYFDKEGLVTRHDQSSEDEDVLYHFLGVLRRL